MPARRLAVAETTSGMPDDSREEDERQEERGIRELRARVRAARAAIAGMPETEEALRRDWVRAACFYAHFGISEALFRQGVAVSVEPAEARGTRPSTLVRRIQAQHSHPCDGRVHADLPSSRHLPSLRTILAEGSVAAGRRPDRFLAPRVSPALA